MYTLGTAIVASNVMPTIIAGIVLGVSQREELVDLLNELSSKIDCNFSVKDTVTSADWALSNNLRAFLRAFLK